MLNLYCWYSYYVNICVRIMCTTTPFLTGIITLASRCCTSLLFFLGKKAVHVPSERGVASKIFFHDNIMEKSFQEFTKVCVLGVDY